MAPHFEEFKALVGKNKTTGSPWSRELGIKSDAAALQYGFINPPGKHDAFKHGGLIYKDADSADGSVVGVNEVLADGTGRPSSHFRKPVLINFYPELRLRSRLTKTSLDGMMGETQFTWIQKGDVIQKDEGVEHEGGFMYMLQSTPHPRYVFFEHTLDPAKTEPHTLSTRSLSWHRTSKSSQSWLGLIMLAAKLYVPPHFEEFKELVGKDKLTGSPWSDLVLPKKIHQQLGIKSDAAVLQYAFINQPGKHDAFEHGDFIYTDGKIVVGANEVSADGTGTHALYFLAGVPSGDLAGVHLKDPALTRTKRFATVSLKDLESQGETQFMWVQKSEGEGLNAGGFM